MCLLLEFIHNWSKSITKGHRHGVTDEHLPRAHDSEVGDVHQDIDHSDHRDSNTNGERQVDLRV